MRAKSSRFLVLALAIVCAAVGDLNAQAQAPEAGTDEVVTAPVEIDGTVIFIVRGVTSFPAESRAGIIRDRILATAANPDVTLDSIRTVDGDGMTRIVAADLQIMTVLDIDAGLEQIPRSQLAAAHLSAIRQAVTGYRQARSASAIRRDVRNALGATLALIVFVLVLQWLWRRIDRWIVGRLQHRIQAVEIKSFELMRAEHIWSALRGTLLAIRTLVYLAVGLIYLGLVLAGFPWTRGAARGMLEFALGPIKIIAGGVIANIPSLVFLVVLFIMVRLVLRLVALFFNAVARGSVTLAGFYPDWAQPTYKLVRAAIVVFALVVGYPYIPGSDSDAFKGVSIFIGIVFSLGSSSAISNLVAGYMMTYRRAFKVGDIIQVGDSFGRVTETRLQVTHLRSTKNEELILPNSQILGSEVRNYSSLSQTQGLILHTEVGIGYETPWRQVEAMLIAAAGRTEGLAKDPPPFVLEKKLGDFAVTYELNAYCRDLQSQSMLQMYARLHRNILDVFNEYGVQIMTPAYEGDPAEPKVVPRKNWHTAPAVKPVETTADPVR
jgi:small-conductance mechanosensitive channel